MVTATTTTCETPGWFGCNDHATTTMLTPTQFVSTPT
jgi:lipase ATG15